MHIIKNDLIAACGMNCALCIGYSREKNRCPGCKLMDEANSDFCRKCIIKNCEVISNSKIKFCYICKKFPCKRLKALDKRYRVKYEMSMIDNLIYIKDHGIRNFLKKEKEKWQKNDMIYCVHRKEYKKFLGVTNNDK
jgi:hypothetical protein